MSPLVAIDGPGGSGKSTIARAVAARLGLERLDTGAMYRAVTLLVVRAGIEPTDAEGAARLAHSMRLEMDDVVVLDGEDVTEAIRTEAIDAAVSAVAAHPRVRAELVARQRAWYEARDGAVVEGRDIGTVVFPNADLKIFLTAHPKERARRRQDQRRGALAGASAPLGGNEAAAELVAELARRDRYDSTREASPLAVAADAVVVDSTEMSVDQVVEEVLSHL